MGRDRREDTELRMITLALAAMLATPVAAQDQDFDPNDPMSVQRCVWRCLGEFDIDSPEYGACVERQCNSTEPRGLDAPGMTILANTDLPGGDIDGQGVRGVTFPQCQTTCLADARCVAVSWVEASGWCWPKAAVGGRQTAAGIMSALRD